MGFSFFARPFSPFFPRAENCWLEGGGRAAARCEMGRDESGRENSPCSPPPPPRKVFKRIFPFLLGWKLFSWVLGRRPPPQVKNENLIPLRSVHVSRHFARTTIPPHAKVHQHPPPPPKKRKKQKKIAPFLLRCCCCPPHARQRPVQ